MLLINNLRKESKTKYVRMFQSMRRLTKLKTYLKMDRSEAVSPSKSGNAIQLSKDAIPILKFNTF